MFVSRTEPPPTLQLATSAPPDVAPGVSVVGVGTRAAREDHTHQGIGRTVYPGQSIQAALDAAGDAGGGLVTLMPGLHVLPDVLYARQNVSVRGIAAHPFLTRIQGAVLFQNLGGFMGFQNFTIEGVTAFTSLSGSGTAMLIAREMAFVGNHALVVIPGFPPFTSVPAFAVNDTGYNFSFTNCGFEGDGEPGFSGDVEVSVEFIGCDFRGNAPDPVALKMNGWSDNITVRDCRFRGAVVGQPSKPKNIRLVDCEWEQAAGQTHYMRCNPNVTWTVTRGRIKPGGLLYLVDNGQIVIDDLLGQQNGASGGATIVGTSTFRAHTTSTASDPGNDVTLPPLNTDVVFCLGDGVSDFTVRLPQSLKTLQGRRVTLLNGQGMGVMSVLAFTGIGDTIRNSAGALAVDSTIFSGVELQLNGQDWVVVALRPVVP